MELHAELERLIADPAVAESVTLLVEKLLTDAREQAERQAREVERRDGELHAARSKIQALTLELAHLKRMRYGVRSEALDAKMRDLFQETLEADIAAAQLELTPRPGRGRGWGRAGAPQAAA
jgi:hypothetical protein